MQLLIYTPAVTNRTSYIFSFIFKGILNVTYQITTDKTEFLQHNHAKLSYANEQLGDELFFRAAALLAEDGIRQQQLTNLDYDTYKVCYPVSGSFFPFDVFSMSFYLVSRYEEYLPSKLDQYQRYQAESSLAYKNGFLNRPVIDEWALEIKKALQSRWPDLVFGKHSYRFLPTIDIDRAYAYRSSGIFKNTARFLREITRLNFKKALQIPAIMLGLVTDPFDSYYFMDTVHRQAHVKPIFFFLLGNINKFDVNAHFENAGLRKLIASIYQYADVGIHPSYQSNLQPALVEEEKTRLENVIQYDVIRSRQHYLRLHLPKTYQNLIAAGLKHDYSMGYSSQPGFRAGTCTPFNWYDLSEDKETALRVYPFAAMELTMQQYKRLNPVKALAELKQLCDHVRNVNGLFITLWHNESLYDTGHWKGWKKVYQDLVEYAAITKNKSA